MCRKTLLSLVLSASTLSATMAQAAGPQAYLNMEPGFFGMTTVVVDGKTYKSGLSTPGYFLIADAMSSNPLAAEYARKHRSYAIWGQVSVGAGLAGALTYLFTRPETEVNYPTYWLIFSAGLLTGLIFQKSSYAYLNKAINAYNGVELADLYVTPALGGAQLGLAFRF
ncbi:MAG TPA: hypothetical protein VM901_03180 [Bdellovibrionota bacterium]|jgi:hypothetical protein|nr:hypothetical protein [Bdellovibrionota bacterium]